MARAAPSRPGVAECPILGEQGWVFFSSNEHHTFHALNYLTEKEKAGLWRPALETWNWLRGLDPAERDQRPRKAGL